MSITLIFIKSLPLTKQSSVINYTNLENNKNNIFLETKDRRGVYL